jgi:hypothetical protein
MVQRMKGICIALLGCLLAGFVLGGCGVLRQSEDASISTLLQPTERETATATGEATARQGTAQACPAADLASIGIRNAGNLALLETSLLEGWVDVVADPGGEFLGLVSPTSIALLSMDCPEIVAQLPTAQWGVPSAIAMQGSSMAAAFGEHGVLLWQALGTREGFLPTQGIKLRFSPPGDLLAVVTDGPAVELWGVESEQLLQRIALLGPADQVTFSPDGASIAVQLQGDLESPLLLYEVASGQLRETLGWPDRPGPLYLTRFSPDWGLLAWVSRTSVLVMDPHTGEAIASLEHEDAVEEVAFSPDGTLLAVASAEEVGGEFMPVVKLWDGRLGTEAALLVHSDPVTGLAFSPDGSLLAAATFDGSVWLWDVSSGECLNRLDGGGSMLIGMFFELRGRVFATLSLDGVLHFWGASP